MIEFQITNNNENLETVEQWVKNPKNDINIFNSDEGFALECYALISYEIINNLIYVTIEEN
jgi:hypothetical protein